MSGASEPPVSFSASDGLFQSSENDYFTISPLNGNVDTSDTYVNFESARRVCFHPKVLHFLQLLFEERPVAFQQLLFQRSNGHPLHQDTAYVTLEKPLEIINIWDPIWIIGTITTEPYMGELSTN